MFDLWDDTDTAGLLCSTHYSYFGSLAFFFFQVPKWDLFVLVLGDIILLLTSHFSGLRKAFWHLGRGAERLMPAALMGQSPTPEPAQNKTLCPWPFHWGFRQTCFPSKLTLEAWGSAELHLLSCAKGSLLPPRVHDWWHLKMEGQVFPHITRPWAQVTPAVRVCSSRSGRWSGPSQPALLLCSAKI